MIAAAVAGTGAEVGSAAPHSQSNSEGTANAVNLEACQGLPFVNDPPLDSVVEIVESQRSQVDWWSHHEEVADQVDKTWEAKENKAESLDTLDGSVLVAGPKVKKNLVRLRKTRWEVGNRDSRRIRKS